MRYGLALLSPIPVVRRGGEILTLDLWARDLEIQGVHASPLKLLCPTVETPPPSWSGIAPVPAQIEVVAVREMHAARIAEALSGCDLLQVPGGQRWIEARTSRRMVTAARRAGLRVIVGISSNRGRAAVLNARSHGAFARVKGLLTCASIWAAQRRLTSRADGTFIVGEGLRPLVSPRCRSLHVGSASWIRDSDLEMAVQVARRDDALPLDHVCIASRLERMKGVHVGIAAFARICSEGWPGARITLTILGAGPERAALEVQASAAGISDRVRFAGTRTYPLPFFRELRRHGMVLLTNLSDEQARIVFDAISQGCIPVCPDMAAYAALELPPVIMYRPGDAASLADAIRRIRAYPSPREILRELVTVARRHTLDAMHSARAAWIEEEVLACRPPTHASAA